MTRVASGNRFGMKMLAAAAVVITAVMARGEVRLALPPVDSLTLENGLRAYFVRDEIPQITVSLRVGLGKLQEGPRTAGLAELAAKALLLGGSRNYPGQALRDRLDELGARLSVEASWEETVITVKALAVHAPAAFAIVADLAANPLFADPTLATARGVLADEIRRRRDDPGDLAVEKAREILFNGDGYGSVPTPEGVRALTAEQLGAAWQRALVGGNLMLGVAGQAEEGAIRDLVKRHFGGLPAGAALGYRHDEAAVNRTLTEKSGSIFLIVKDIPQATVVLAAPGPGILSPGQYALSIMNYVLGGGSFNSRLMHEIRVTRGMAYAVYSVVRFRKESGLFLAFAQTENATAPAVLSLMSENIASVANKGITEAEARWAKGAIAASYVFRFETPGNIVASRIARDYYGLPKDFDEAYLDRIGAVTLDDIRKEGATLFSRGLVRVVVGPASLAGQLQPLGNVVTVKP